MNREKKIQVAITVLAILLGLSLVAIGATVVYDKLIRTTPAIATVPDNLITPEDNTSNLNSSDSKTTSSSNADKSNGSTAQNSNNSTATSATSTQNSTAGSKEAITIDLYNKQPEDNTPFQVGNMFPGDSETKYFRVQVSYHDKVTVHYKAIVREGYEKLAEVMKVKVKLLTTGETMYDGLMKDMPDTVTYQLASAQNTTDELYYEITAYLDTSVGNDYQNLDLRADFSWWVEETGNLTPAPSTGDNSNMLLLICFAVASGSALLILLLTRGRKKEEKNA